MVGAAPMLTLTLLMACSDPAVSGDSPAPRDDTPLVDTPGEDTRASTDSDLVSAFFGLDDSLPVMAAAICLEAPGRDGMPLVFRRAVDGTTLDASDFEVERASGVRSRPLCATLLPANEADELRTVLLIGDLADAEDAPIAVSVTGALTALDGTDLLGMRAERVVALEAGPSLALAERAPQPDPELGRTGRGGGCPLGTMQVVTVTWEGGVTVPGVGDVGDAQRAAYTVSLEDGTSVSPISFADGMDNDNVQDLCIDSAVRATRVSVRENTVVDPRGDLNPATSIDVP